MSEDALLEISGLVKHFPMGGGLFSEPRSWVKAVDGVSFTVARGESFGLVGESGCGKTTLGRLVLRLLDPTAGSIKLAGKNITHLSRAALRPIRRQMQIIFQDPFSSLDPRMKVESIVSEPLRAHDRLSRKQRRMRAAEMIEKVGLKTGDLDKYPHEFSGGQRQRIGIARSLCVRPRLIVADEPVSALDVSIQAQVINLLEDLRDEFGLSYVFISHDLSVVEHMCDQIAVMYLGVIVEMAPAEIFSVNPRHPYTRALLSAVPQPNPLGQMPPAPLKGDVPSPIEPPAGCVFHTRCKYAGEPCRTEKPSLVRVEKDHFVACWLNKGTGGSA
jgi:peptide/nickel transport system ATP-binding protein